MCLNTRYLRGVPVSKVVVEPLQGGDSWKGVCHRWCVLRVDIQAPFPACGSASWLKTHHGSLSHIPVSVSSTSWWTVSSQTASPTRPSLPWAVSCQEFGHSSKKSNQYRRYYCSHLRGEMEAEQAKYMVNELSCYSNPLWPKCQIFPIIPTSLVKALLVT